MIKDITLGQYFPGNSPLHRMDPRLKILLMLEFVVLVFFASNFYTFLYLGVCMVVLVALSGISAGVIVKGLKPILFISLFTALINVFWTTGDVPLVDFYFIHIYPEGLWRALYMIVRIVCLVTGTSVLLTYTTSPMDLTDALESLLSPLKKLHVPVHEFAMMMSLALRFVPTLIEETEKIINAQKARGADFESGNLLRRAKALVPILIPLFISAFSRATELAVAMECRCYTGGDGRTRMKVMRVSGGDLGWFLLFTVLFFGIIAIGYIPCTIGGVL